MKSMSSTIVNDGNNRAMIEIGDNTFYPQEVASIIPSHLKNLADSYINDKITACVISVSVLYHE